MNQSQPELAGEPQPEQPTQQVPVEGTVVASGGYPVGFAGAPGSAPAAYFPGQAPVVQQGWWNQPPTGSGAPEPAARRRRWVPFALAGAGLALLLGGGAGGYAIGHHSAAATSQGGQADVTGQADQPGSGTDGQFPGLDGQSGGQFGGPMGGQFGGQLGQQGGSTGGDTGTGTDTGTDTGTSTGTTT